MSNIKSSISQLSHLSSSSNLSSLSSSSAHSSFDLSSSQSISSSLFSTSYGSLFLPTNKMNEINKINKYKMITDNNENKDENINNVNEFAKKEFVQLCENYDFIPTIHKKRDRIIALGDIHGDYALMIKMLLISKVIKINVEYTSYHDINLNDVLWTGGDTVIVQVGDQIDRCRPGSINNLSCDHINATYEDEASDIRILNFFTGLHYKAKEYQGMVISLLGNHELMNVEGDFRYVSKKGLDEFNNYIDKKNMNKKFIDGEHARKYAFKPSNEYGLFLGCTRVSCLIIGSNLFVHGGFINSILNRLNIKTKNDIQNIDILVRKWLMGLINKEYVSHIINSNNGGENSMFWNRILGNLPTDISNEDPECYKHTNQVLQILEIGNIIIGHTPQSFLHSSGINGVCSNKIWRVDNGSSAAFNGYDLHYKETGIVHKNRQPQVLEILNDSQFNVLM